MMLKSKPTYVKILIVATALVLLAAVAVGALLMTFGRDEALVVSLGETGVTQKMFDYYLASYKYEFLVQYKEEGLRDMGNSWRSVSSDGTRTWEERFYDEFSEFLARKIAAASLFDASYSLSGDSRTEIGDRLQSVIKANGGKAKTNELLARYGCDTEDLRRAVTLDYKCAMLYGVLYGTDGSGLPDGLLEETYQKEYARVKTVFIRTKGKLSDGTNAPMSEEALEDAERRIAALQAYLDDGMDEKEFLSLQEAFNEDEAAESYPNGYYLSKHVYYDEILTERALAMKAGEFAMVEGEYGTYLLYRMSNPFGAYAQESNAEWFRGFVGSVTEREYAKLVDTVVAKVRFEENLFFDAQVIQTPKNYEVVY
ncbi:MAG: hypothetical protein IKC43_00670 [Clostridia bacterium]|nr:hypothetical protein [Clostridia bacterium]